MKREVRDIDFSADLVRYISKRLKDEGWEPRRIVFVADALYPQLPTRFAVEFKYETTVGLWRDFCTWAEPDNYVDVWHSVDKFVHRVCGLKYSSPPAL